MSDETTNPVLGGVLFGLAFYGVAQLSERYRRLQAFERFGSAPDSPQPDRGSIEDGLRAMQEVMSMLMLPGFLSPFAPAVRLLRRAVVVLALMACGAPANAQGQAGASPAGQAAAAALRGSGAEADRLDVRSYGARCDGVTDDQAAFNAASRAAVDGARSRNGATRIIVPAGRCRLSAPWIIRYDTNTSLTLEGAGSASTELRFDGGVDGIVVSFAPYRQGNEMARSGNWHGQAIAVKGFGLVAHTGGGLKGTALSVLAIPLINASTPPFQIYDDILIHNDGGWNGEKDNWAGGLYLQDPDNAYVSHVIWEDHLLRADTSSVAIHIHSTAQPSTSGHGNLNFTDVILFGGRTGILIDGRAIQGVNLTGVATIGVRTGLSWHVPANSLSGSLTINHSSMSGECVVVSTENVSTVFSDHNFYYNTSPKCAGGNWLAFQAIHGDTISSIGDQVYGPAPGMMGPGFKSYGIEIYAPASYDAAPSVVVGDTVTGTDVGYVASGGPVAFTSDTASSATSLCYQDGAPGAPDPRFHPVFALMSCGNNTLHLADGIATTELDPNRARALNGVTSFGMPGVRLPLGLGAAPVLEFHSVPSADGTQAGLNNWDARIAATGGAPHGNGQAAITVDDGRTVFNSPVLVPALRFSGFVVPATSHVPCTTGTTGDGTLGGVPYHFFCYATDRWARWSGTTAGW